MSLLITYYCTIKGYNIIKRVTSHDRNQAAKFKLCKVQNIRHDQQTENVFWELTLTFHELDWVIFIWNGIPSNSNIWRHKVTGFWISVPIYRSKENWQNRSLASVDYEGFVKQFYTRSALSKTKLNLINKYWSSLCNTNEDTGGSKESQAALVVPGASRAGLRWWSFEMATPMTSPVVDRLLKGRLVDQVVVVGWFQRWFFRIRAFNFDAAWPRSVPVVVFRLGKRVWPWEEAEPAYLLRRQLCFVLKPEVAVDKHLSVIEVYRKTLHAFFFKHTFINARVCLDLIFITTFNKASVKNIKYL